MPPTSSQDKAATALPTSPTEAPDRSFKVLFECAPDAMFLANGETGIIEDANQAAMRLILRPLNDLIGMHFTDLHPPEMVAKTREHFETHLRQALDAGELQPIEHYALRSDGTVVPVEVMATILSFGEQKRLLGIFRDISRRRQLETELREAEKRQLSMEIEIQRSELEKINAALAMMLDHARKVEADIKERVTANIRHVILPVIDMLKKQKLPPEAATLVSLLENSTRELAHPLASRLDSPLLCLTTREMQFALLIREGKTTKDIMEILSLSFQTVQSHRNNLRRKLGIRNKKINLQTYLKSGFPAESSSL